jgi:acyl-CoA thioester hydrolase
VQAFVRDALRMEHRLTIPVRWSDLDMLGHLNQAVYHELLEEARGGLLVDAFGPDVHGDWVLVRIELDHHREVRKDHGTVDAVARVAEVGTKSLKLDQELVLPDGTVAASGRAIMVAWDGTARTSRALSDQEREALQASRP